MATQVDPGNSAALASYADFVIKHKHTREAWLDAKAMLGRYSKYPPLASWRTPIGFRWV